MDKKQKEMETVIKELNKSNTAGTHIHLHEGSSLTYIESECGCTIRLIRCMLDKPQISDPDFRHFVKILIDR